jgi:C4-dicarboxylate-specific signal transduction histidine kinase
VAHEINNPLAIIAGKAFKIKRLVSATAMDSAAVIKEVVTIENTVQRISKIIHGLRTFAREGDNDPFEKVQIHTLFQDVAELSKTRFANHGINFKIINPEPDITIDCRQVQLGQVLLNLLNNAHDAVEELSEKWIELSAKDLGDNIEISVLDSGKGIPEQVRLKLQQPFFTTKAIGKGTGLGLSISRGIIQSHNGSLSIDAKSPNTRFVVLLPKSQKNKLQSKAS